MEQTDSLIRVRQGSGSPATTGLLVRLLLDLEAPCIKGRIVEAPVHLIFVIGGSARVVQTNVGELIVAIGLEARRDQL